MSMVITLLGALTSCLTAVILAVVEIKSGFTFYSFVLKIDPADFPAMVRKLEGYGRGENIPDIFVPHLTLLTSSS